MQQQKFNECPQLNTPGVVYARAPSFLNLRNMKRIFFLSLLLLSATIGKAQITQDEYDALQKANMGEDKAKAATLITAMEKKYPTDPGVLFQRGYFSYYFEKDYNKALVNFSSAIKVRGGRWGYHANP